MKKERLLLLIFSIFTVLGNAQTLTPLSAGLKKLNPVDIFPADADKAYQFNDNSGGAKAAQFAAGKSQYSVPAFTAEIFAPAKSHYAIQSSWKSNGAIKKGDVVLARFSIRSIYAKQESGEAVVYFYVQQANPPHDKSVITDLSVGPEWKNMDIAFVATRDMDADEASVNFSYAALAQKVEITNLQLLNFEKKATLAQMPVTRFTYKGREDNAAWRNKALKRIDSLRTASLTVNVVDANGQPISGAKVEVKMVQSAFIWGTAANEATLAGDSPDSEKYKKYFKEFFNTGVIENGFKWPRWHEGAQRQAETKKAFEWLEQNGFRQRGHNIVWPGFKFAPRIAKETAEKDTAEFRKIIDEDIRSKMAYTKGRVIAWDVINELLHERDFLKYLPANETVRWFQLAKELDPDAQLFINEYSMLNSVVSPRNIKSYLDTIAMLRKSGAPIEAIGIQGHVGRQPRNPEQVISDLDMFTSIGLPVQITEFDINMTDEALQADYTRDFLIACYSHPVITGFTIWGFWQPKHWKPDAAMFRTDWSAKPNAAIWREWVNNKWKTQFEATTDIKGKVEKKGHFGKYEVTVSKGGKSATAVYELTTHGQPVTVTLK
jgi:GH35 family endo-1,4-beta-xylanase